MSVTRPAVDSPHRRSFQLKLKTKCNRIFKWRNAIARETEKCIKNAMAMCQVRQGPLHLDSFSITAFCIHGKNVFLFALLKAGQFMGLII